jgi:hypothetical protein
MACEDEAAAVQSAQERLAEVQAKCFGLDPDDPETAFCQSELALAEAQLALALERLRECRTAMRIAVAEGLVTFLRVHELRTGFGGGQTNFLDAEAVFRLDSRPDKAFGFQLRDDKFLPARRGMLDLLRDAVVNDLLIRVDFLQRVELPNQNSVAIRIAVLKPPPITRPPGDVLAPT